MYIYWLRINIDEIQIYLYIFTINSARVEKLKYIYRYTDIHKCIFQFTYLSVQAKCQNAFQMRG